MGNSTIIKNTNDLENLKKKQITFIANLDTLHNNIKARIKSNRETKKFDIGDEEFNTKITGEFDSLVEALETRKKNLQMHMTFYSALAKFFRLYFIYVDGMKKKQLNQIEAQTLSSDILELTEELSKGIMPGEVKMITDHMASPPPAAPSKKIQKKQARQEMTDMKEQALKEITELIQSGNITAEAMIQAEKKALMLQISDKVVQDTMDKASSKDKNYKNAANHALKKAIKNGIATNSVKTKYILTDRTINNMKLLVAKENLKEEAATITINEGETEIAFSNRKEAALQEKKDYALNLGIAEREINCIINPLSLIHI